MPFLYQILTKLPRPIHVLTTVAGLLITFRAGTLIDKVWNGKIQNEDSIMDIGHSATATQSETKPEETKKPEDKKEDKKEEKKPEPSSPETKDKPKKEAQVSFDPLSLNESQVKMLQTLSHRRKEMDEEAEKVRSKKALMELSEKKISEKLDELKKLKESIEKINKDQSLIDQEALKKLVKIYESMKPAAAAQIFNHLDLKSLLQIIPQMNQKKSSAILSAMEVPVAKVITAWLLNPLDPLNPTLVPVNKPGTQAVQAPPPPPVQAAPPPPPPAQLPAPTAAPTPTPPAVPATPVSAPAAAAAPAAAPTAAPIPISVPVPAQATPTSTSAPQTPSPASPAPSPTAAQPSAAPAPVAGQNKAASPPAA